MKVLIQNFLKQSRLTQWITLLVFILIILSAIATLFSFASTKHLPPVSLQMQSLQIKQAKTLAAINQVQLQFNMLVQQLSTANQKNPQLLSTFNQRLDTIQQALTQLQLQLNLQPLQQQLTAYHQQEIEKIVSLQNLLQSLKKQASPALYLTSRALPFQLIGIDEWNGEPKATIQQGVYYDLMGQGDTRDGWTLMQLSFNPAQAIFGNEKKQLVQIKLK